MMTAVLPMWARLGFLSLALLMMYGIGVRHGERREGLKHLEYVSKQAEDLISRVQIQQKIVTKVETKYRDRYKVIYLKGEEIEKSVKDYISPVSDARCIINVGFVRVHDAAWTNTPPGTTSNTDADPTGVSLAEVGEITAHNAKACHLWRDQAIGWREYYEKLKALHGTGIK